MKRLKPTVAIRIANGAVSGLVAAGAGAVVLTGSHARGEAGELSDIDLHVIGVGPAYRLEERDGRIVSISWHTVDNVLASFLSPASAGAVVPGWRSAVILHDPAGVASNLVERARGWTWHDIGGEALDAWVANELTGLAEEVLKLVQMLELDRVTAAAVQRNVLALRVPVVMATHLRLLYDSENVLWDLVAASMGSEWYDLQAMAFGSEGKSFRETCIASLRLYALACDEVAALLDARQRDVVSSAIRALGSLR